MCVSSGLESSSQPAHIRPSAPGTRSTPQRAAAGEAAQSTQAKAALKQVHSYTHILQAAYPFIFAMKKGESILK